MKTQILNDILRVVSSVCEIPADAILSKCKRNDIVDARCIFVHFASRKYGFKAVTIAQFLNRKRTRFVSDCLTNYEIYGEQSAGFRLMSHDVGRMLSDNYAITER